MLDMQYYATSCLNEREKKLWFRFFSKRRFKSLRHLTVSLKNMDLSWIREEQLKLDVERTVQSFLQSLENERISFNQKLKFILDQEGFSLHEALPELQFKTGGSVHGGLCPRCGKKELFIPKKGHAGTIICNRKNKCGYSAGVINYMKEYKGMSAALALKELADVAGVDLNVYERSFEVHAHQKSTSVHSAVKARKKPAAAPEIKGPRIDYMRFDKEIKPVNVNWQSVVKNYKNMDERRRFIAIATAIYKYSKKTDQTPKERYYAGRGLDADINPVLAKKVNRLHKDLGYIGKDDLFDLVKLLKQRFGQDDLVYFGVINPKDHAKAPLEFKHATDGGFCVIPSFDLYTNMITGLKLRNTKLKPWQNKSMKEPEMSFGRIANPLPYALTRDALLDKEAIFRLFEGTVDAFSMPTPDNGRRYCDIGIPGTNGISQQMCGLFKGRQVELWFDADKAGREAVRKLAAKLSKAGASVVIQNFDKALGEDINECLINGNIDALMQLAKR